MLPMRGSVTASKFWPILGGALALLVLAVCPVAVSGQTMPRPTAVEYGAEAWSAVGRVERATDVSFRKLADIAVSELDPGARQLRLDRVTIQPNAALTPRTVVGPEVVYVERGPLVIVNASHSLVGTGLQETYQDGTTAAFVRGDTYTVRNIAEDAASVLRLSLLPARTAATPLALPNQPPSGDPAPLFDAPMEWGPTGSSRLVLAKLIWNPHGRVEGLDVTGVVGLVGERGTLDIDLASGFDGSLLPLGSAMFASEVVREIRYEGPDHALTLLVGIVPNNGGMAGIVPNVSQVWSKGRSAMDTGAVGIQAAEQWLVSPALAVLRILGVLFGTFVVLRLLRLLRSPVQLLVPDYLYAPSGGSATEPRPGLSLDARRMLKDALGQTTDRASNSIQPLFRGGRLLFGRGSGSNADRRLLPRAVPDQRLTNLLTSLSMVAPDPAKQVIQFANLLQRQRGTHVTGVLQHHHDGPGGLGITLTLADIEGRWSTPPFTLMESAPSGSAAKQGEPGFSDVGAGARTLGKSPQLREQPGREATISDRYRDLLLPAMWWLAQEIALNNFLAQGRVSISRKFPFLVVVNTKTYRSQVHMFFGNQYTESMGKPNLRDYADEFHALAVERFEEALACRPGSIPAMLGLAAAHSYYGQLLRSQGKNEQAWDYQAKALKINDTICDHLQAEVESGTGSGELDWLIRLVKSLRLPSALLLADYRGDDAEIERLVLDAEDLYRRAGLEESYNLACFYSVMAGARHDAWLAMEKAHACLARSIAENPEAMSDALDSASNDLDLENLRGTLDWPSARTSLNDLALQLTASERGADISSVEHRILRILRAAKRDSWKPDVLKLDLLFGADRVAVIGGRVAHGAGTASHLVLRRLIYPPPVVATQSVSTPEETEPADAPTRRFALQRLPMLGDPPPPVPGTGSSSQPPRPPWVEELKPAVAALIFVESGRLKLIDELNITYDLAEGEHHMPPSNAVCKLQGEATRAVRVLWLSIEDGAGPGCEPVSSDSPWSELLRLDLQSGMPEPASVFLARGNIAPGHRTMGHRLRGDVGLRLESGTCTVSFEDAAAVTLDNGNPSCLLASGTLARIRTNPGTSPDVLVAGVVAADQPLVIPSGEVLHHVRGESWQGWQRVTVGQGWHHDHGPLTNDGAVCEGPDRGLLAPFVLPQGLPYAVEARIRVSGQPMCAGFNGFGVNIGASDTHWIGTGVYVGEWPVAQPIIAAVSKGATKNPLYKGSRMQLDEDWHWYRAVVRGRSLQLFIDGEKKLSRQNIRNDQPDRISLWCHGLAVEVADLRVVAL